MIFGNNPLWHLIAQSDFICQLVLLILLGMSIACWAVFISRFLLLRSKKNELLKSFQQLRNIKTIQELVIITNDQPVTVAGLILSKNISFFKTILESRQSGLNFSIDRDVQFMQDHIQQSIETIISTEESYLPFLSGNAAVSPLLGLFGTVWGLVHAFVSISQKQTADITVVAPGIAEALITTLAGLVVAIPALVMYNYLVVQTRTFEQYLVNYADKLNIILQKALLV